MKTFGGEHEESAGGARLAWEQVKLNECEGDVLSGFSVGQNSSCRFPGIWRLSGALLETPGGVPLQLYRPEVIKAWLTGLAM